MKTILLFFTGENDPNGHDRLRELILTTLKNTDETTFVLIISEIICTEIRNITTPSAMENR